MTTDQPNQSDNPLDSPSRAGNTKHARNNQCTLCRRGYISLYLPLDTPLIPPLYTLHRFSLYVCISMTDSDHDLQQQHVPPPAFLLVFQITKKARKIAFVHHAWVDVTGVQKWRRMQENAGMHFYRLFPILVGSWSADINSLFRKVKRAGNPLPSFVPLSLINLLYPARCVEPIEL